MARQSPLRPAVAVLVTRPEPQASRFAADLTARFGQDVAPLISALMMVEYLPPTLPDGHFAAIILTSETGALAAARLRRAGHALPDAAFCVGDRTAQVAQDHGFTATSAQGDVGQLADLILSRPDDGPLLYLHGQDRAGDLAQTLKNAGRRVQDAAAYAQRPCPLSDAAVMVLQTPGLVIAPVFSVRSARLLAAALPPGLRADVRCACISAAVCAALPPQLAPMAEVALCPDGPALIDAIARVISSGLP